MVDQFSVLNRKTLTLTRAAVPDAGTDNHISIEGSAANWGEIAGNGFLSGVVPGQEQNLVNGNQPAQATKAICLSGKRVLMQYPNGLEIQNHYLSLDSLEWEIMAGPSKGAKGTETIHTVEIAPRIFFISWLERSGTTVSHVVDFNKSQVAVFVTIEAGKGRKIIFGQGALKELEQ